MSNFIPLPPTYAVLDPQVRAVLDVLSRNMQVVIDSGTVTTANTAITSVGGASTFGSGNSSTNITNLAPSYTLDTLTADLKRGAAEVITGVTNGTTVMKLEPAGQYVVFQHRDASILGTVGAYAGTIRTGLGITSTGILGGYNRQSDGAWQTTFAIESSTGNLTLLGTLRAASIISVDAFLGSTLVSTVVANSASVTTKLNKSAADILSGTIEFQNAGGFKTGTIVVDGSGNATGAGVAITSKGIVGRNAGATTFTIDAVTGAATFKGDITGASGNFSGNITGGANIEITGSAKFNGAVTTIAGTAAITANVTSAQKYGIIAFADNAPYAPITEAAAVYGYGDNNAFGVRGVSFGSGGTGVFGSGPQSGVEGNASGTNGVGVKGYGNGTAGTGVYGLSNGSGAGVYGISASGPGVWCNGPFKWSTYTFAVPTGSSSDVLRGNGTWGAVSLANDSNSLGGVIASSWARIFPTNSGNANAGGSGLNILGSGSTGIAGAYVATSGTSNIVTIEVTTTSPSDIRLKEEIADSDLGLAFVKQLRPVSYKLKADPKHQKGYGFIADEVDQIIELGSSLVYHEPDWKVGEEKGFKTIHYPSYIAVLTKAIQELSAKVTVLESKNA